MRTIVAFSSILLSLLSLSLKAAEQNHIFHLDHRNGLSSNSIRSIRQDNHGFVWVTTLDGLNRFDGKEFRTFTKENSGLTSNELNSLLADPVNPDIMWISTRHDGICKFDYTSGLITPYEHELTSTDVPHLSTASDNNIWVTYYHFTPDKLNTATGEVEKLYNSVPEGMPRNFWCSMEDPLRPLLYIGHDGSGFTVVNLKTKQFRNYRHSDSDPNSLGGDRLFAIYPADNGDVWIGTDNGVSIFNYDNDRFENILGDLNDNTLMPGSVTTIYPSANGDLWFGTEQGGVSILPAKNVANHTFLFTNLNTTLFSTYPNALSHHVQSIFEDSYGNKWIGSYNEGLNIVAHQAPFFIQREPFKAITNQATHQAVWSIAKDPEGNLWIGGEDEIMRFTGPKMTTFHLPLSPNRFNTMVRAMYFDSNGLLWIATSNDGAFTLNVATGLFSKVNIPEKEIRAFLEYRPGNMLIGTSGGLYTCGANLTATKDRALNSRVPDSLITALAHDKSGNLWVGTYGRGVTVISTSGKDMTLSEETKFFPSNTINSLMVDSKGNIWAGTRGGAVKIPANDYTKLQVIDNSSGLTNSDVKSIEEIANGEIWMSVNNGIAHYNPASGTVSTYQSTYGKQMNSFAEGSSCTDKSGNLFFGSLNGLTYFNSNPTSPDNNAGNIKIAGLSANDKKANDQNVKIEIPVNSKSIKLPYNLSTFSIKYCNTDISCTANSDFCYNMEGVNEVWTYDNGITEAVYRDLRPGKYTFRIKQRVNGGEWGDPITLATITITPPLYLTWWAKLLYVIAALSLVSCFFYFFKHKVDLEKDLEIEKQKSKNDRQMNEERLVFFTNITHELRTPLSLIIGPIEDLVNDTDIKPEQRKRLLTIRTSSMRLLNLINGILEFRKTETQNKRLEVTYGNFANFIREIGIRFKELNNNPNLNFIIDVADMEGTEMNFDPEIITIILNNLLGNAMKYTKSGNITLALHTATEGGVRYVDMSVSDTGEGISKDALPHIFERYYQAKHNRKVSGTGIGLALTKNLVELHEGSISVESEQGKGSTFTVRLIIDNSYPNAMHKEAGTPTEGTATSEATKTADDNEKLTILVVEDDDDVREYISESFSEDFNVHTAADGKEGLDKALETMPDIIVSDIMMPVMDGIELCSKIKSDSAVSHIPVILLTAKDSLPDKEQGYAAGADSYITKPFSANLLKARINNILESRHKLTMRMLDDSAKDFNKDSTTHTDRKQLETTDKPQEQNLQVELTPFDREFIAKFKALTEQNIEMEELDIAFFTDKMCVSHSTLYRKVKSITGFTPNEFIRKIKLHKAAEMLMTGKVAISEIPYHTGFNSSAYFRRVFKKEFGVSPTEYVENGCRANPEASAQA